MSASVGFRSACAAALSLAFGGAELADLVTQARGVRVVLFGTLVGLLDALQCGFVTCHRDSF